MCTPSGKFTNGGPGPPNPPCPPNWHRTLSDGHVVYKTTLGHEIHNVKQLVDFLLSDVTCKCSLPCPLIIDRWFDFATGAEKSEPINGHVNGRDNGEVSSTTEDRRALDRRKKKTRQVRNKARGPYDGLLVSQLLAQRAVHNGDDKEDTETGSENLPPMPILTETHEDGYQLEESTQEAEQMPEQQQMLVEQADQPVTLVTMPDQLYPSQQSLQVYCTPSPQQLLINQPTLLSPTGPPSSNELMFNNFDSQQTVLLSSPQLALTYTQPTLIQTNPLGLIGVSPVSIVTGMTSQIPLLSPTSSQQTMQQQTQVNNTPTIVMSSYNSLPDFSGVQLPSQALLEAQCQSLGTSYNSNLSTSLTSTSLTNSSTVISSPMCMPTTNIPVSSLTPTSICSTIGSGVCSMSSLGPMCTMSSSLGATMNGLMNRLDDGRNNNEGLLYNVCEGVVVQEALSGNQ